MTKVLFTTVRIDSIGIWFMSWWSFLVEYIRNIQCGSFCLNSRFTIGLHKNGWSIDVNWKRGNDGFQPEQNNKMRSADPIKITKITDLDYDCLEHIFKNLGLSDLLNVADSSKYFKQAVDLVFKNKYQKSCFTLYKTRQPDETSASAMMNQSKSRHKDVFVSMMH